MTHVAGWLILLTVAHSVYHHTYRRWGHGLRAEFAALGAVCVFASALIVGLS